MIVGGNVDEATERASVGRALLQDARVQWIVGFREVSTPLTLQQIFDDIRGLDVVCRCHFLQIRKCLGEHRRGGFVIRGKNPGMGKNFLNSNPTGRMRVEQSNDEILCRRGDRIPKLRMKLETTGHDSLEHGSIIFTFSLEKRRVATEHEVECHTDAPTIDGELVLTFTAEHFRCNKIRQSRVIGHHRFGSKQRRQWEITQLQMQIVVDEKISRLDVSV